MVIDLPPGALERVPTYAPAVLSGKVVLVPLGMDGSALARRLAAGGATVLLVAGEAEAERAGRVAAELKAAAGGGSGRVSVFVDGPAGDDLDPLVEYVEELFRT